jgi:cytochrome c556
MLRIAGTPGLLAVSVTALYAQNVEPIKQRQTAMGTIAKASSTNFKMSKGEVPFNLATVQANLKTMETEAGKVKNLFPDDSKTGGDTDASPTIWQNKKDFNAAADTLVSTIKTAASTIKDEATLKSEYPKVARACGGCHKDKDGFAPSLSQSFKRLQK